MRRRGEGGPAKRGSVATILAGSCNVRDLEFSVSVQRLECVFRDLNSKKAEIKNGRGWPPRKLENDYLAESYSVIAGRTSPPSPPGGGAQSEKQLSSCSVIRMLRTER